MKVKIPHALVMKFISYEGLESHMDTYEVENRQGFKHTVPGEMYYSIKLDLSLEPKLLEACIEWNRVIMTYFQTSYKAAIFDIGPYEGLWPREIDVQEGIVHFHVDNVNENKHNWRDWFLKEDHEYAPK